MWILPPQPASALAPATVDLSLELSSQLAGLCSRSLTVKGKRTLARTFLRRWQEGSFHRLRSGLISGLSIGNNLPGALTGCSVVIPASLSATPDTAAGATIPAISSPRCSPALTAVNRADASLRTSKATSISACVKSSAAWKREVTRRRGEYSARKKSAPASGENGCSLWVMPTGVKTNLWQTSCLPMSIHDSETPEKHVRRFKVYQRKNVHMQISVGHQARYWPTAKVESGQYCYSGGDHNKPVLNLDGAARQWPSPGANDFKGSAKIGQRRGQLSEAAKHIFPPAQPNGLLGLISSADVPTLPPLFQILIACWTWPHLRSALRLNPSFVNWLMGLPDIEWTNCDWPETASCPKPPPSLLPLSAGS